MKLYITALVNELYGVLYKVIHDLMHKVVISIKGHSVNVKPPYLYLLFLKPWLKSHKVDEDFWSAVDSAKKRSRYRERMRHAAARLCFMVLFVGIGIAISITSIDTTAGENPFAIPSAVYLPSA